MACRDCEDLYSFPVGPQGPVGEDGAAGVDGNYVTVANEAAGANCTNGGKKITLYSGADDSVLATHYVCNGVDGSDGSNGASATNKFIGEAEATITTSSPKAPDNGGLPYENVTFDLAFCTSPLTDGCGAPPRACDFSITVYWKSHLTTALPWKMVSGGKLSSDYILDIGIDNIDTRIALRVLKSGFYRVVAIG